MHADRRVISLLLMAALLLVARRADGQDSFRFTDLDLRDPHLFASAIACFDVTSQFNTALQAELTTDSNGDGQLDASLVAEFLPLDRSAPTNLFAAGAANCSASSNTCGEILLDQLTGNATLQAAGTCVGTVPDTTRAAYGAIVLPTGPCFASPTGTISLSLNGIPLTLRDTQLGATFGNDPTTLLVSGMVRGFLSEADADATIIPASYPAIGGQPLSSVLPGGQGNCSANDDTDVLDNVTGWWVYLSFTAARVGPDPFADGFSDSFE